MPDEPIQLPTVWVDDTGGVAKYVNAFMSSFQRDEFTIVAGQVTPPLVSGATDEERAQAAQALGFVPIHTIVRLVVNRAKMMELINALQENLDKHDEAFGQ